MSIYTSGVVIAASEAQATSASSGHKNQIASNAYIVGLGAA